MVCGLVATLLLTTSTPSIIKIDVAPVSAIACIAAINIALRYLDDGSPNIARAATASNVRALAETLRLSRGDVQLDVGIVASSSSMMFNK
jgi:hypothetical protein